MPPKSKDSNSESESYKRGGPYSSRATVKARNAQLQQQTKELLAKHIHNNHPHNFPAKHPLDFESYSDEFLRAYKDHYKLPVQDNMTLQGYLLGSELGKKTQSYQQNIKSGRVTKQVIAEHVGRHFASLVVKESEIVPFFLYKVKNEKKKFKMERGGV